MFLRPYEQTMHLIIITLLYWYFVSAWVIIPVLLPLLFRCNVLNLLFISVFSLWCRLAFRFCLWMETLTSPLQWSVTQQACQLWLARMMVDMLLLLEDKTAPSFHGSSIWRKFGEHAFHAEVHCFMQLTTQLSHNISCSRLIWGHKI